MARCLSWLAIALFLLLSAGCATDGAPDANQQQDAADPAASTEPHRKLVVTASLSLEARDPVRARRQAEHLAAQAGGYVERTEAGARLTELVLRVPVDRLEATLAALEKLATGRNGVMARSIETQDVTDQHTDLAARLKARRALEKRYLALLERTDSVKSLLAVEEQLGRVRTEIEQLEAQLASLDRRVDFATLHVRVEQERNVAALTLSGIVATTQDAYANGVQITNTLVSAGIHLVGVMIPLTVFLGLPTWMVIVLFRRARRPARASGATS